MRHKSFQSPKLESKGVYMTRFEYLSIFATMMMHEASFIFSFLEYRRFNGPD